MYLFVKRIFDIVASLIAIICLSWLFIPIIIILACTGEHEIFYRQMRVGKEGKLFGVLKFATMLKNSPNMGPFPGLPTLSNKQQLYVGIIIS